MAQAKNWAFSSYFKGIEESRKIQSLNLKVGLKGLSAVVPPGLKQQDSEWMAKLGGYYGCS